MIVRNPRCEWQAGAVVTDTAAPRLTWELSSAVKTDAQTAYQAQCGTTAGAADLWDTGKTTSATQRVAYAGVALASRQRVYWRVRVWNAADGAGPWASARFEMGLLSSADWAGAAYIGFQTGSVSGGNPAAVVRKAFVTPNKVVARATLYASALGVYRPFLNGQRVGQVELAPGWTDYPQRRHYQTYDVTPLVVANGQNAVALQLGDGWYLGRQVATGGPNNRNYYATDIPRGLAALVIDYADGTTDRIVTDNTWVGRDTANRLNDNYDGATHDARLDSLFSSPVLDTSAWSAVSTIARGSVLLQAQPCQPIRRQERIAAVAVTNPAAGVFVFDMGQNHAGVPQLRLAGLLAGTTVTARTAEDVKADGSGQVYRGNLRTALSTFSYTTRGDAIEIAEPLHTYFGFRYVEITGHPGTPALSSVASTPLHVDTPAVGSFACSNSMMNAIWKAMAFTDRANMNSTYTDCPQRDERLGWNDAAHLCFPTGTFFRDRQAYMRKYLQDLLDSTNTGSGVASLAPYTGVATRAQACWADAATEIAWALYQIYGDPEPLAAVLAVFKGQNLLSTLPWGNVYNDYLAPATDANVFTQAWAYRTASILAKIATAVGDSAYAASATSAASSFLSTWQGYIAADGTITGNTQTAYLLGFTFGMIPAGKKAACLAKLVANIQANGLVVGLCGVTMWYDVLADNGQLALAYTLAQSSAVNSVGYTLTQGGTTLSEQWNPRELQGKNVDIRGNASTTGELDNAHSMAHSSRGPICGWFMRTVAGIDLDPAAPGYANVIMRPRPDNSVTWAEGEFDGPRGRIESKWQVGSRGMTWVVVIPPNCTATLTIPTGYSTVKVGGASISTVGVATTVDPITGGARWNLPSGSYSLFLTA